MKKSLIITRIAMATSFLGLTSSFLLFPSLAGAQPSVSTTVSHQQFSPITRDACYAKNAFQSGSIVTAGGLKTITITTTTAYYATHTSLCSENRDSNDIFAKP